MGDRDCVRVRGKLDTHKITCSAHMQARDSLQKPEFRICARADRQRESETRKSAARKSVDLLAEIIISYYRRQKEQPPAPYHTTPHTRTNASWWRGATGLASLAAGAHRHFSHTRRRWRASYCAAGQRRRGCAAAAAMARRSTARAVGRGGLSRGRPNGTSCPGIAQA